LKNHRRTDVAPLARKSNLISVDVLVSHHDAEMQLIAAGGPSSTLPHLARTYLASFLESQIEFPLPGLPNLVGGCYFSTRGSSFSMIP
jgi:hypothetical protein